MNTDDKDPAVRHSADHETSDSEGKRIVNDFLEVGCLLGPEKRAFLIREMNFKKSAADSIDVRPCFTLDQRLVCIIGASKVAECWFYYPSKLRIIKRFLRVD